jgi:hypothetical protein
MLSLVPRVIADTLDSLELRSPKPEKGARDLRIE